MPMDEDAMFKALLTNKPKPKPPVANEIKQAPAQSVKPAAQPYRPPAAKGSEDAMYKALLHSRPAPPVQKPQVRVEPRPEPMQPTPHAAHVQQEPEEIAQASPPPVMTPEPLVDSINDLTASVSQLQSLMKTTVLPVMILILLVEIVILVKMQ